MLLMEADGKSLFGQIRKDQDARCASGDHDTKRARRRRLGTGRGQSDPPAPRHAALAGQITVASASGYGCARSPCCRRPAGPNLVAGVRRPVRGCNHVFFCSRATALGYAISVEAKAAMLENLRDVMLPVRPALQHVQLVHGLKWKGSHVGPIKLPAKESDPPHADSSFYRNQQGPIDEASSRSGLELVDRGPEFYLYGNDGQSEQSGCDARDVCSDLARARPAAVVSGL
jgi:hypothetical protein